MNRANDPNNVRFGFLKDQLFRNDGIEIWKQNGKYLVIDRGTRYGKFYNTLEDAKNDDMVSHFFYGVVLK